MILAIGMKQALSTICYMMTATTTDAQIAEQVERWYPSRAGMNEYNRVLHMGQHCRDRLKKTGEAPIWYGTNVRVPPAVVKECAEHTQMDPWNPKDDTEWLTLYDCYSYGMGFYD